MKNAMNLSYALLLCMSTCISAHAAQPVWKINPAASFVDFHTKNFGMSVDGKFGGLSGEVHYDGKHLANSDVDANVSISTINTGIGMRDSHLKSKDFFDAKNFPQASFKSTKIEEKADGSFVITGQFTLHGISKELVLSGQPLKESEEKNGQTHLTAHASTSLLRKDFKIGGFAAASVANAVRIDLTLDLVK
jgi:polyisoprenoid-binding protein YceI